MLINILRFIRGYVDIEGEGKYPERFINLTVQNGIYINNMMCKNNILTGSMSVSDYRNIRAFARKSHMKTKIIKKHGLPFAIQKYRSRTGLVAGLVLFILITSFLSQFVWNIQINGAENISRTYVMSVLEKNGLYKGVNANSLNIDRIQRSTLLEIDSIRWMSINIDGCNVNVEIKEKAEKPKIEDNSYPCNIVAKKDGVITSVKCVNGVSKVKKGFAAAKGQLLVSAVAENKTGGYTLLHSKAEILAKTFENKTFSQKTDVKITTVDEKSGIKKQGKADFFFLSFPCSLTLKSPDSTAIDFQNYALKLNDVFLPIGYTQEVCADLKTEKTKLSDKCIKKALENQIALYEAFTRSDALVLQRKITESKGKSETKYTVSYVFEEDIAKTEKLQTS